MKNNCNIKNPLVRDGASQSKRMLDALKPEYAKVDERSVSDMLWFAYRYAKKLQYYDSENKPYGDWKDFIENDISTIIAFISQKDLTAIKDCRSEITKTVENTGVINNKLRSVFKRFFNLIFIIAGEVNDWHEKSVDGLKLRTELSRIITSELREQLKIAIGAYKHADTEGYLYDIGFTLSEKCAKEFLTDFDILNSTFNVLWIAGNNSNKSWSSYLTDIEPDALLFGDTSASKLAQIKNAALRLEYIFEIFINSQTQLIFNSPGYMQETLKSWPNHEPHMALFLTFIQLFWYSQNHINTTTKRHLDFYYKDILQLQHKSEVPDRVHVIFELAKQVSSYLLKNGTLLKAGKDAAGVEVLYSTDADIVLNKAKVDFLKNVFIDRNDNNRIYSAPTANSKDGLGGEFDSDEPKWKPFGKTQQKDDGTYLSEDESTMEFSQIGFAIASSVLLLKEGTRTLALTMHVTGDLSQLSITKADFKAFLSGEKEWIEAKVSTLSIDEDESKITVTITLNISLSPVIEFDSSTLNGGFDTTLPVLKLQLVNNSGKTYLYAQLKELKITQIDLSVVVNEVQDIILQNDTGALKPNKPFYPFGTSPGLESGFYIGSKEIFQKKLSSLTVYLDWKDIPAADMGGYNSKLQSSLTNKDYKVNFKILYNRKWNNLASDQELFDTNDAKTVHSITLNTQFNQLLEYQAELITKNLAEYSSNTKRGFIRVELTAPSIAFGHNVYRDVYTKAIIAYAKNPTNTNKQNIPNEPYTPLLNPLKLDYTADESISLKLSENFDERTSKFFHLYPFGCKESHENLDSEVSLLPQFTYESGTTSVENEGELYIGISNLSPRQNLSILFQVAEGSADPELSKQEIDWCYLSANKWIPFTKKEILSDTTNGLISSGIVTFDVPKEADNTNSLLASGYHWLRASISANSGAVCDIISVHAQAVQALYTNNNNDPNFLTNVLPKDTITKLQVKDSSVKSVSQPYASLGGQTKEQDDQFYTRVSERLRHKERGISIWDYERLVLQHFPSIYKVKCINHSTYNTTVSEFAPGYVTVIVIPNLKNKNAVNPLEPRASLNTLDEVKTFLTGLISPFAANNLKVINPLYEKIKVEFKVSFFSDFGYYSVELENDLIHFLSPWAFEDGKDIVFGGKIHKSVILNFIEEREYVDFVTNFKMIHITVDETGNEVQKYVDEAEPTTARSILVSNDTHTINEADEC